MPLTDSEGFTELALGPEAAQMPAQQMAMSPHQDTHMVAEFFLHPVEDSAKSAELGRPFYADKEYIRIMQPGNKTSEIVRPVRIGSDPKNDNHRFAYQYAMFKQNAEQTMVGTPLREWPGATASQVKNLELVNVKTVEQLAEMDDTQIQSLLGAGALKQKAKDWLSNAADGAVVTQLRAELEERDARLATQDQAIEELMARVKELEKEGKSSGRRKAASD